MPKATPQSAPTGTPPAGGRWTWDGAQWVPLPEATTPASPDTAADQAAPQE